MVAYPVLAFPFAHRGESWDNSTCRRDEESGPPTSTNQEREGWHMFDHNAIYQVLDGHFVMHLVREGESISEDAESGNETDGVQLDTPEIMLEDLIDEIDGALEELHVEYNGDQKYETLDYVLPHVRQSVD